MSFITNPISRRVGFSLYWNNIWSLNTWINYSVLNSNDKLLLLYLKWFIKLFKWNHSRKYSKIMKKLSIKYKIILNNDFFWLWPEWKILRFCDHLVLICHFNIQNINNKIPPIFTYKKQIIEKKINKGLITFINIYNKYFLHSFILEISVYYSLRLFYFKLIKYIYIYCYWYFSLKSTIIFSINKYILYYIYLKKIYKWFYFWSLQIKYYLHKINNIPIIIYYHIIPFETITAIWLLNFIKLKLLQNYSIKLIITNIFKQLNFSRKDIGFLFYNGLKICVSGRFTRTERKLFWWQTKGFLGQSKFNGWFEYASTTVILTNSTCGLKIWLRKDPLFPKIQEIFLNNINYYTNAIYFQSKKVYKIS